MFEFRARLFRICILLLPVHCCFAATIYVNANNPTPGAGTSWTSAYTDLVLALAAAHYGDQIWVAQGTYKPTATTDRTMTFKMPDGVNVYGGFNGTESTLGARNWTSNLTILSGDIGTVGDQTDNCYNIVTYANTISSPTLDGFTIRDGNGNQNYPASNTIQPYNQAGGILAISAVNGYAGATIVHCILTNNFGVFGGGFCAYANGTGAVIEVTIANDLFLNNSSINGGAIEYLSMNGGAGLVSVSSCIFNNNICPGGGGTAISGQGNANSALCSLLINNCTFYNNNAPLLSSSLLNGGHMNFFASDCIMWQSGGFFSSPVSSGSNINLQNSNVDLAIPGSGITNNDPQFVNAPAGNFHLQPCSPDIDAGGFVSADPNPVLNYDYGGNARVQNGSIDYGAYESGKITSATTSAIPATYCQSSTAVALTDPSGVGLLWYTTATGGTGDPVAPVPVTMTVGTTTYWVTQTLPGQCESNRTSVTVTIKALSAAPTVSPVTYCENAPAAQLTATGTNLNWYTAATGGSGSLIAPTPSTTTNGSTTYYVTQTTSSYCESPRTPIVVTVNAAPAAPTASPVTYCQNASAVALTATGTDLLWYTAATGGVGTSIAPVPPTTGFGTTTWYVSQTSGCESPRAPVTVTVNALPAAPTASPVTYCQNASAVALSATGTDLLWYTSATGGVGSAIAPVPSTTGSGTTTWYVSQTIGCESPRIPVTVLINPNPTADFTWKNTCVGKASVINASTGSVVPDSYSWDFGNPNSVTGADAGPYDVSWDRSGDYSVTLTTITGTCQSIVEHTVSVYAPPSVEIAPVTTNLCVGSSFTLEASGASSYQWSPSLGLSDPAISNPSAMLQSNMIYTVTGTDANGCEATAQVALQVSSDCLGYFIPNAFTPNGDGHNDQFRVKTGDAPRSYRMLIFNRYGSKVFESSDIGEGWNGGIGGSPAASGTYVYMIAITTSAGTTIEKKGTVELIR